MHDSKTSYKPEQALLELASDFFSLKQADYNLLQGDGSDRKIVRFFSPNGFNQEIKSIIGVYHQDIQENEDFLLLTRHLSCHSIPVPKIFSVHPARTCYLMEDLGDQNLAESISQWEAEGTPEKIVDAYKKILDWLPIIQSKGVEGLEEFFSFRQMDNEMAKRDLSYFRRNFLERFAFMDLFSRGAEEELDILCRTIASEKSRVFVYRDFQSRNFMWFRSSPYFIDYQSAMIGPLYYDLASMLYASRSGLTEAQRGELIPHFLERSKLNISEEKFSRVLYQFVLLRRLRSLGTYGYLSMEKGKTYFLQAIRPTLKELDFLLSNNPSLTDYSNLRDSLLRIADRSDFD